MSVVAELERVTLALTAVITAETRALTSRDLVGAAALGPAKTAALEAFVAARARMTPEEAAEGGGHLAHLVDKLRQQVEANRRALEEGLALQAQVVETIAGAVAQPASAAPGYGPQSSGQARLGAAPLAVSVNA
ncbi:hypothetical protein [Pseudoroseomonas cervicalis]|uniref:hypothetical protein n=1 Tax=Teichococcus cervicalis TaxID=204525 RepID=UPI0022F156DA|nr:hypothetical protein [Pseudoroseomonas cervicalis]WBV44568.1 hypothetical protein PFY06_08435 [Pseudoroseomonas cervicalis]